jgi:hypothetical protein
MLMPDHPGGEKPVQKRYTWTGSVEIEHLHRGTPV